MICGTGMAMILSSGFSCPFFVDDIHAARRYRLRGSEFRGLSLSQTGYLP